MLREIAHFAAHAPGVARLSTRLDQAALFDHLMENARKAGLDDRRARLVAGLEGRVLEIGCGTGAMLRPYGPGVHVTATEPVDSFFELARKAAEGVDATVDLRLADAQDLPFEDASFDAVVVASVLCSVEHPERALAEIRRVLRPGAEVRLMEHVRSEHACAGALMHVFNPVWRAWNRQGYNMNRRTVEAVEAAGFEILERERFQIFADGLPAFPSVLLRVR